MPMAADTRRAIRGYGTQNRYVPLWTPTHEGQWVDGKIDVPLRLANALPHTNEHHALNNLIRANIERWVAWRAQRGWFINSNPQIVERRTPPISSTTRQAEFDARATSVLGAGREITFSTVDAEPTDFLWFMVRARFIRRDPIMVSLEDVLEMRRLAHAYEVDVDADFLPENILPPSVSVIDVDGGEDPMVVAENRRRAHGLHRADYIIGKLSDPL